MSVEESRRLQTEPIDLDACLKSFTREEELGEDELYYCSKCKNHRLAAKKLEIWKLPPVLVSLITLYHNRFRMKVHLLHYVIIWTCVSFRLST